MDYLNQLTASLSERFGSVLPNVLGALLVLILGFFIAGIVRRLVKRLLGKTKIDEKIGEKVKVSYRMDDFIAKLFYYLVVIYTLIIVLNLLGVESVLKPLEEMLSGFVGFLPNIIAAGIIGFAGFIISKIASEATGFISERLEAFGSRLGLEGNISLAKIVKQIVFIIIFIPILIVALDTLKMDSISQPATEMLSSLLNSLPKIIAAVILLAVFFLIGRYVVGIVTDLLKNLGLDNLSKNMGISNVIGDRSLSKLIGNIALFFIMFAGIIAAADKLELTQLKEIFTNIFNISGKVFFGIVILMAGVFISNVATSALSSAKSSAYLVPIVRFGILGIFLAFGLHTMGIAESIVNLAFGLTLGAIAVAFALSFGLGGREAAGKQMESFFKKINKG